MKEYVYKQRYYPIGVTGGTWVELWNLAHEMQQTYECDHLRRLTEKVDKTWNDFIYAKIIEDGGDPQ